MRGSAARRIPSNISLRLLQVVHRHGDRAPTFNPEAFSDNAKMEAKRWSDVLAPTPSRLSQDFPVVNPNRDGAFDEGDTPWGCLTSVGAYQCLQRGRILRRRYHRFLFADGTSMVVTASSSNFVRTQLSAQHVLAGLLPRGSGAQARAPITITVEPAETGVIAVFDSTRPLMQLVRSIMAGPDYMARDEKLAAVAAALTDSLPYFSGRADPAAPAMPPRFMWIRAADYFWAYESHGLEPRAATLREQTTSYLEWRFRRLFADPQALALASGGLLAALAANMRAAVAAAAAAGAGATAQGGPADAPPQLALFSGHDATLMPLVTALLPPSRAVLVARAAGSSSSGGSDEVALPPPLPVIERTLVSGAAEVAALARDAVPWPAYASAVSLELHYHAPASASAAAATAAATPLLLLPSAVNGQDSDAASLAFRASAAAAASLHAASSPWAGWRLVWSFDTDILTVDGARAVHAQQQQHALLAAAAAAPPSTAADSQLEAALLESAHAVRPLHLSPAAEATTAAAGTGVAPRYPRPALPEPGSVLRMTGWMPLADFLAAADAASAAIAAAGGQVGAQQ